MASKAVRSLVRALIITLVVVLILCGFGVYIARRSFPQTSGSLAVAALHGPVQVYRDAQGIPQIYAQDEHDLFFAQGYVQAQDRFWQMDFWRHIGSGTLSEMFGDSEVKTDLFLRTLGWARVSQQEVAQMDPATLAMLQDYADGVNSYLAGHQGSALSLEYSVLSLLNPAYRPAPWEPVNTLTWAKVMSWDLGGNMDSEIERSILLKTLGPDLTAQIVPSTYPSNNPTILPNSPFGPGGAPLADTETASLLATNPQLYSSLTALSSQIASVNALTGGGQRGLGSNDWTVSGSRTTTGMPIVANDPHLDIQMPSIWYQMGLHCAPKTAACPFDVVGFTFAGAPGVIIGHNDQIAWGVTNVNPDVQDLYIEKINPSNPDQYQVNGKWVDMTLVKETIHVAGGKDVPLTVRYTRHGPIVSDTYASLQGFGQKAGLALPAKFALALRWTALEPSMTWSAILKLDQATNFQQFRDALRGWDVPSQNFVYADVQGNIGYQVPGKIPIRAHGNGLMPVPGWTDEYEWTGYIPFDQLPYSYNPPQGFIVSANNQVVGSNYPYLITLEWDKGYRAARITQMIEAKPKLSLQDMEAIQGDDYDASAAETLPYLEALTWSVPEEQQAVQLLKGWDLQDRMDSTPAAIYNAFYNALLADTFHNKLPKDYWPEGDDTYFYIVGELLTQPNSPWWDDPSTPQVERRDDILRRALNDGLADLQARLGGNMNDWQWGQFHTATFQNQSLGESGVGPIEALFNRGPYAVSGSAAVPNATAWEANQGYAVTSLPSMRMLVDLSNFDNSLTVNTTGQSGHAYNPHYDDLINLWRTIQYYPMLWSQNRVISSSPQHLTLTP
ncbi:MAG: penicillin acylase family protein [Anaerolineales bacterium]|jgi:penicillin amidase